MEAYSIGCPITREDSTDHSDTYALVLDLIVIPK
jgi:hypothetical protein